MIRFKQRVEAGFALPTILIASVIMLIVLVSAVTATESVRSALDRQYYNQLARETAESGLAFAELCLQYNGYEPSWSYSYPLRPDRDCSGMNSNGASQYILNQDNVRTTFTVDYPTDMTVSQLVTAHATVELLRTSNGQPWKTYTYDTSARVGIELNLNTVAFGYVGNSGAYFLTISADGKLRGTGYNGQGQLSSGSYSDSLSPTTYRLNGSDKATSVFTNFLSQGYDTFVLTDKGDIYGAGLNNNGQLGDGSTGNYRNQAVEFGLPSGKVGKYVNPGGNYTFVLTTDNNVYSAGACQNGVLGYSYTISGCTNQGSPHRINLPTPSGSDTNTLPTTNIVSDFYSGFVRMQGGRVYGWGFNGDGELANGNTTDSSTPVKISTYGDSGQSKATQVAFDGSTVYVLDSNGNVKASGYNFYGEMGSAEPLQLWSNALCIDNKNQDGEYMQFHSCNGTVAQDYLFRSDGSIYNPNTNQCLQVLSTGTGNSLDVRLRTCSGATDQQWKLQDDRTIKNTWSGKCINNYNNDNVSLVVYACVNNDNEHFYLKGVSAMRLVVLPAVAGTVKKVATDQWFVSFLTDNGQVWSIGKNDVGQLGNGTKSIYQPYPVQFKLPAGVTAVDVYSTSYGTGASNTFVIGSDGKVYGAGDNDYGQLGDGTTTDRSTPVAMQVIDGTNTKALQVQSGGGTTVILTDDHKIYTVGNNNHGQLGDGTTTNSSVPHANRYTNVLPITVF